MGLKLKNDNSITESTGQLYNSNTEDWDGVKKDGGAIGPYGVNRHDLGLDLFGEARETERNDQQQEDVELKITSQNEEMFFQEVKDVSNTPSISKAIDLRTYTNTAKKETSLLLLIFTFVAYIAIIVKLATIGWICSKDAIDIYFNTMSLAWVMSAVSVVLFIDVIVVNVVYKRNIFLIIIAWLLDFVYPSKRGKHTGQGEMIGTILSVTMFIAYVALILLVGKAVNNYGNIIQIEDEKVRAEAAVLLDQKMDGVRMGNQMMQNIDIEEVVYGQQSNKDVVILEGNGSIYLQNGNFVISSYKDTKTTLGFVKSSTGQYELTSVTLGDQILTDQHLSYYWEEIMK